MFVKHKSGLIVDTDDVSLVTVNGKQVPVFAAVEPGELPERAPRKQPSPRAKGKVYQPAMRNTGTPKIYTEDHPVTKKILAMYDAGGDAVAWSDIADAAGCSRDSVAGIVHRYRDVKRRRRGAGAKTFDSVEQMLNSEVVLAARLRRAVRRGKKPEWLAAAHRLSQAEANDVYKVLTKELAVSKAEKA